MKKSFFILICVFIVSLFSRTVIAGQDYFCIDEASKGLDQYEGTLEEQGKRLLKEKVSFNGSMTKMVAGTALAMEYSCKKGSLMRDHVVTCLYDDVLGIHKEWWSFNLNTQKYMHTILQTTGSSFSGTVVVGYCHKL